MNEDQTGALGTGPLPLPEGDHEVMVVDVEHPLHRDEGGASDAEAELSLVILKGPLKGQVVSLGYPAPADDLLGLLGSHGILTATRQGLRLRLED